MTPATPAARRSPFRPSLSWLLAFVPLRYRSRAEQTLIESERVVVAYAVGNGITSIVAFAFTWVVLWWLDVPAALLLAVEVEGGSWSGGRHTSGAGFAADCEKYNEATLRGWRVLRVTGAHVKSGAAVEWLRRAVGEAVAA